MWSVLDNGLESDGPQPESASRSVGSNPLDAVVSNLIDQMGHVHMYPLRMGMAVVVELNGPSPMIGAIIAFGLVVTKWVEDPELAIVVNWMVVVPCRRRDGVGR